MPALWSVITDQSFQIKAAEVDSCLISPFVLVVSAVITLLRISLMLRWGITKELHHFTDETCVHLPCVCFHAIMITLVCGKICVYQIICVTSSCRHLTVTYCCVCMLSICTPSCPLNLILPLFTCITVFGIFASLWLTCWRPSVRVLCVCVWSVGLGCCSQRMCATYWRPWSCCCPSPWRITSITPWCTTWSEGSQSSNSTSSTTCWR